MRKRKDSTDVSKKKKGLEKIIVAPNSGIAVEMINQEFDLEIPDFLKRKLDDNNRNRK
ncbi:MAG: hypothetical protein WD512_01755 [Candidatus Paceibacterota bacterium]